MRQRRDIDWPRVWTLGLGGLAAAVATIGTVAVAVAGFTLSYDAIRAVGVASHIRAEWSWLLPVSIDGAMAVASVAAVVLRRVTGKPSYYAWSVVGAGVVVSVACNGIHATGDGTTLAPDPAVRFAVSAIPPMMLALSLHLLVLLVVVSFDRAADGRAVDATCDKPQVTAPVAPLAVAVSRPAVAPRAIPTSVPTTTPTSVRTSAPTGAARVAPATQTDDARRDTARRRVAAGESCARVATSLGVSKKTVERWTSDIRAARHRSGRPATSDTVAPINGHDILTSGSN